jgi:HD-like signal output (HDOD) protein
MGLPAISLLRPVAKPLSKLWEKSIAVASICQVLANQLKVPPDKVFAHWDGF